MHGSLTSVFVLVGLATNAPPTYLSYGDEDTDRSVDVGTTGCYIPPKYAHVCLRRSHASYSMNSQPVQRLWKLTTCRQAVGTCMFLAVVVHGPLHVRIRIFTGRIMHTAVYGGVDILLYS